MKKCPKCKRAMQSNGVNKKGEKVVKCPVCSVDPDYGHPYPKVKNQNGQTVYHYSNS